MYVHSYCLELQFYRLFNSSRKKSTRSNNTCRYLSNCATIVFAQVAEIQTF